MLKRTRKMEVPSLELRRRSQPALDSLCSAPQPRHPVARVFYAPQLPSRAQPISLAERRVLDLRMDQRLHPAPSSSRNCCNQSSTRITSRRELAVWHKNRRTNWPTKSSHRWMKATLAHLQLRRKTKSRKQLRRVARMTKKKRRLPQLTLTLNLLCPSLNP